MTTSLISPAELAEVVGQLHAACECVHCAPHARETGCHCDQPAAWLVWFSHMGGPADPGGYEVVCGIGYALCAACLEAAKGWALGVANSAGISNRGRCFACDGGPLRCIDDVITAVAL